MVVSNSKQTAEPSPNRTETNKNGWIYHRMDSALSIREQKGTLRKLKSSMPPSAAEPQADFSSNDYLGLAVDPEQSRKVHERVNSFTNSVLGATGSRLLSGDSHHFHELEMHCAEIHGCTTALLCNSGYAANVATVSCLPCDTILFDEYVHNSLHMGMRLWRHFTQATGGKHRTTNNRNRRTVAFRHNSVDDLRRILIEQCSTDTGKRTCIAILIESVYSMDGDVAPIKDMLDAALEFGAVVLVDEAHGLGIVPGGKGLIHSLGLQNHQALHVAVYTFGKAAGCHGAVIACGSETTKSFLVNYANPIMYSTALPLHSLITIRCAYDTMTSTKGDRLRSLLEQRIRLFRQQLEPSLRTYSKMYLLPSTTPIQALIVPGNSECDAFCRSLHDIANIVLYPIKSPTVPVGMERVRIVLHSHNTVEQVEHLVRSIILTLSRSQYVSRL